MLQHGLRGVRLPRHARPAVLLLATLLVLGLIACGTSDDQLESIRESNAAAASIEESGEDVSDLEADVSVFDLRVGDCVQGTFSGIRETMTVVPCSSSWSHVAIDALVIDDGDFPGEDVLAEIGSERCDRNVSDTLEPTSESWSSGDRTIVCFASEDSLTTGEPGECFGQSQDDLILTGTQLPCSQPHFTEVFHVAFHPDAPSFPGDRSLAGYADEACVGAFEEYVGAAYDESEAYILYYLPSAATWNYAADRRILCFLITEDGSPVAGQYRGSGR